MSNATQLTASQLPTFLTACIEDRAPVLITGAPGIGKSDIMEQAARAAGADLLVTHPAVSDPTDFKGLPWAEPGAEVASFLPFGDLARMVEATSPLVVVLDDLGQAPPSVQAAAMQLLLARHVNGHKLPECVTFLAATNRREDRAGVSGMLEPVKSRCVSIVELVPDLDGWCSWALSNGVPVEVVAFIRFRPDLLCKFEASADLVNSPVPRTWTNAARILGMELPADIESAAVAGAVGEAAAVELLAFLRMFRDLPNLDAIILDPDAAPVPDSPAALYATVTGLGNRTTEDTFPSIASYAGRLISEGHGEFGTLLVRDCIRQAPAVKESTGFRSTRLG